MPDRKHALGGTGRVMRGLPDSWQQSIAGTGTTMKRSRSEADIDDVLTQSFPASDPPSWTLGEEPAARADTRSDDRDQGRVDLHE